MGRCALARFRVLATLLAPPCLACGPTRPADFDDTSTGEATRGDAPESDSLGSPDLPSASAGLRVYHSPYAEVDWTHDRRLIAQFHDHVQTRTNYLDLYDAAGYDVVPLFHYTGLPALPGAWTEIHWPAEDWLPTGYAESLSSIERFYPGGEHADDWHITGPFLTSYIEHWEPQIHPVKHDYHYETNQELIDQIATRGGYPVLAHPWAFIENFDQLEGLHAVEVYSAFGDVYWLTGKSEYEPEPLMQAVWDDQLERDPQIYGLAVNDWHGPFCVTDDCLAHPEAKDSGKVELLAPTAAFDDVEHAFATGAMFAVKDYGTTKLAYPRVESITVTDEAIEVLAPGEIVWISHAAEVETGALLELDTLAAGARHVRAEVHATNGSKVFVQPFWLAPIGDIDGDGDVDSVDSSLCEQVLAGLDTQPDHVAAVAAAPCN